MQAASVNCLDDIYILSRFQRHHRGVYSTSECKGLATFQTNHALVIVGYGTETYPDGSQVPYWLVRNSWGATWAENGYAKYLRGANLCNIESWPLYIAL